jgi:hypothetical protein
MLPGRCRSKVHARHSTLSGCRAFQGATFAAGVLSGVLLYGPHAADHCLLAAGLQPGAKVGLLLCIFECRGIV